MTFSAAIQDKQLIFWCKGITPCNMIKIENS